jgi:hypothetical protein
MISLFRSRLTGVLRVLQSQKPIQEESLDFNPVGAPKDENIGGGGRNVGVERAKDPVCAEALIG